MSLASKYVRRIGHAQNGKPSPSISPVTRNQHLVDASPGASSTTLPADVAPATCSQPMTRRSMIKALVSAASALVAVSAPSIAAGDAELIRLGAEFDLLTSAHDQLAGELKLLDAQCGIADELTEDYRCGRIRRSEFSTKIANIQEAIETMTAMFDHQDMIANTVDTILQRILTSRATTLAGLAVKAHAARLACSHFYKLPDNEADLDVLHSLADRGSVAVCASSRQERRRNAMKFANA